MPEVQSHCVVRCPACERPIWWRRLVVVLGLQPLAKRHREVALVAETGFGARGWRFVRALGTIGEVEAFAGREAVEQLRRLARQTFERLWLGGLLTKADIERVTETKTLERPLAAPLPSLDVRTYVPLRKEDFRL